MVTNYKYALFAKVIALSENKEWDDAVKEWEIVDCVEDEQAECSCVCGKDGLRYLFTIRNSLNGNELEPIGSSCIKKFGREDLTEAVTLKEKLFKLYHAVKAKQFLEFNTEFFSRKLLKHLYDIGAFAYGYSEDDVANNQPEKDYTHALKVFRTRNKSNLTYDDNLRTRGIIGFHVKNYLFDTLPPSIRAVPHR